MGIKKGKDAFYAVIMAGGRGERFWPFSRTARPKQFVDLFGGRALLSQAVDRLAGVVAPERTFIVTSADLVAAARAAAPALPAANIVGEPCGRDTAAACALGTELVAAHALASGGVGDSATLAILTADHLMADIPGFRAVLSDALSLASSSSSIVTIGIKPEYAATGFGYIESAGVFAAPSLKTRFAKVARFVEKPDAATAAKYLAGGRHFWNSGMFVWSAGTFRRALRAFEPALADAMAALAPSIGTPGFGSALAASYAGLRKISVDYAVMEHAGNIVMAFGDFGWDDVGSWNAVANHFPSDSAGNVVVGGCAALDSTGNIVVSGKKRVVALCGVKDLVVVETPDVTLVCRRDQAQRIKELLKVVAARPDGPSFT